MSLLMRIGRSLETHIYVYIGESIIRSSKNYQALKLIQNLMLDDHVQNLCKIGKLRAFAGAILCLIPF